MKQYIGDSVYVEIESGMVRLTTENGLPDDPSNVIYLEPMVVARLLQYIEEQGVRIGIVLKENKNLEA